MPAPSETTTTQRPLDADAFARYAVRDPLEVAHLLKALVEKRLLLTAFIDGGESFITLTLAVTDDGAVIVDACPDEIRNAKAGSAARLVCTTRLDNVKLQFALETPARIDYAGRPALRAALPESIIRLQRREFYRLPTPQTEPLVCVITHVPENGRRQEVLVRIVDISGGGLAVLVPPRELPFEPGTEYSQCSLRLPDGNPLPVSLKVRNLFEVEKANGVKVLRAGCEFMGLSNPATARIQRYMFKLERDRRMREEH
ncbi:flagellar regulator YcgR PilZN domain-containing protein [Aromatoleum evansii]|uniref:Flagellar brake protein YcgR n=1 Tax=Aromatoleum evansii TaxID=59406 RepID=A0ABZ1AGJ1_AROEV|nr:flagellar regulator YcgR PilZN domain-containing protein [Aromatoleum evansii]